MKIGLLHVLVGGCVVYLATRGGSSGSGSGSGSGGGGGIDPLPGVDPGFLPPGGGGGGKTGPGSLGGGTPAPPPNTPASPFRWTQSTCLPIVRQVDQTMAWCTNLGKNAPKNLTAAQYRDYAIRAAMGSCYPPPADPVNMWGRERVGYYYGYYRSFLNGLRGGKRLGDDAAQAELTKVWQWLESIDPALVVTLDPWLVSRW